jgi:hypothetical protein
MRTSLFSSAILLAACTAVSDTSSADMTDSEMAIREAVFRHQFESSVPQIRPATDYFFLELEDGQDPSAEFLARFSNAPAKVEPRSMCEVSKGGSAIDAVRQKVTGGRGRIFWVGRVCWISATAITIKGGYFQGRRSASGYFYRVEKQHGRWEVVDARMDWIS